MLATGTWGREFRCRGPCSLLRPPCSGRRWSPWFRKMATQLKKLVRSFTHASLVAFLQEGYARPALNVAFGEIGRSSKNRLVWVFNFIPTLSKRRTRPSSVRWPKSTLRRGNRMFFLSIFLHFSLTSPRIKLAQGLWRGALLPSLNFF